MKVKFSIWKGSRTPEPASTCTAQFAWLLSWAFEGNTRSNLLACGRCSKVTTTECAVNTYNTLTSALWITDQCHKTEDISSTTDLAKQLCHSVETHILGPVDRSPRPRVQEHTPSACDQAQLGMTSLDCRRKRP